MTSHESSRFSLSFTYFRLNTCGRAEKHDGFLQLFKGLPRYTPTRELQIRKELLMGKVIVFMNLTLDGVMQGPAEPDEDRRGGFEQGGWGAPYAAMTQAGESTPTFGALLLGRRTYERFYAVWPKRKDSPFSAILDNLQKYVASTTLSEPLAWINSTLLKGDA